MTNPTGWIQAGVAEDRTPFAFKTKANRVFAAEWGVAPAREKDEAGKGNNTEDPARFYAALPAG